MNDRIKLIVLNGSPNKNGNTSSVIKWVVQGAKTLGAEVDWIQISDLDITYCQGCNNCLKTGKCVINDDLPKVVQKIENADGIIVGSPVYGGKITAQLKTLIDRITLLKLYAGILENGYSIGVATSGIAPTKKVAKEAANMFGKRIGVIGIKTASLSGKFKYINEKSDHKKREKAIKLGKTLAVHCEKGGKYWSLKSAWINFLRKHFLKRLIKRNRGKFAGVIEIWKKKGWL